MAPFDCRSEESPAFASLVVSGHNCILDIKAVGGENTIQIPAGGRVFGLKTLPDACIAFPNLRDYKAINVRVHKDNHYTPGLQVNVYKSEGGTCTCPDGSKYEVQAFGNGCRKLSCKFGKSGPCTKHGPGWKGRGMEVTCAYKKPEEETYNRPCRSGDVKLPVNGMDPYVPFHSCLVFTHRLLFYPYSFRYIMFGGKWQPICMHYFQVCVIGVLADNFFCE